MCQPGGENRVSYSFRSPSEARDLARKLSQHAPEPPRAEMGLFELMMNAIEHGNLEIGAHEKRNLLAEDRLVEEIQARLTDGPYKERLAKVDIIKNDGVLQYCITDEGKGFDWARFMQGDTDASLNESEFGRGILLAKSIGFDGLAYSGIGNVVTASIKLK